MKARQHEPKGGATYLSYQGNVVSPGWQQLGTFTGLLELAGGPQSLGVQMRTLAAILMLLALTSAPALAAPSRACLTQSAAAKAHPGQYLKYRQVGSTRCWFAGDTPDKSEFKIIHATLRAESANKQSGVRRTQTAPAADDALVGL